MTTAEVQEEVNDMGEAHFAMKPEGLIPPGVYVFFSEPGTVKSTMALTFPGHLKAYDFDLGMQRAHGIRWEGEGASQKLVSILRDDITIERMLIPQKSLTTRYQKLQGFQEMWTKFTNDFNGDCENPDIKSIAWDTATVEWKLLQDAYLEELQDQNVRANQTVRKQLQQIEFGEPNQRQNMMFAAAKGGDKNLILTHHEADEYVPVLFNGQPVMDDEGRPRSAPSGRKMPDGFRYTLGKADWVFNTVIKQIAGMPAPVTTCVKSALGLELVGTTYTWWTYGFFEKCLKTLGKV
ncbi:hypothetical protein LCGC14_2611780 [marine sediment metagenome]|uniref:Uncharacterized protein n=1 Tax=marine sediment metagenome TaxID=412755 RepID=A0A0F9A5M8_9ZZZZ